MSAWYETVAVKIREAAVKLREVDEIQASVMAHRLDPFEPLAGRLDAIAARLEEQKLGEAMKEFERLVAGLDQPRKIRWEDVDRAQLAAELGRVRSEKKKRAAQRNGSRGGRPRKDGRPIRRKAVKSG